MLKVTKKQYEIEEKVQAIDENDNVLYEFDMKITPEEMIRINEIMINRELIEEKDETKSIEIVEKLQEEFENICFKEHKEPFKEKAGMFYYLDMVNKMFSFFWEAFVTKKMKQVDTMNSDLRKISNK